MYYEQCNSPPELMWIYLSIAKRITYLKSEKKRSKLLATHTHNWYAILEFYCLWILCLNLNVRNYALVVYKEKSVCSFQFFVFFLHVYTYNTSVSWKGSNNSINDNLFALTIFKLDKWQDSWRGYNYFFLVKFSVDIIYKF